MPRTCISQQSIWKSTIHEKSASRFLQKRLKSWVFTASWFSNRLRAKTYPKIWLHRRNFDVRLKLKYINQFSKFNDDFLMQMKVQGVYFSFPPPRKFFTPFLNKKNFRYFRSLEDFLDNTDGDKTCFLPKNLKIQRETSYYLQSVLEVEHYTHSILIFHSKYILILKIKEPASKRGS